MNGFTPQCCALTIYKAEAAAAWSSSSAALPSSGRYIASVVRLWSIKTGPITGPRAFRNRSLISMSSLQNCARKSEQSPPGEPGEPHPRLSKAPLAL